MAKGHDAQRPGTTDGRALAFLDPSAKHRGVWKRTLDVLVSAVLLIITGPWLALAAIAIRLAAGPGAVVIRFPSVGEAGKPITLITLRALRDSHEAAVLDAYGPFADRVDRVIRTLGLDQLPVLFSVLRGDLSLVGPAPVNAGVIDWADPVQQKVFTVKPGMTGLAQLARRSNAADRNAWPAAEISAERLRLDCYYLDHQSPLMDVRILLRTLAAMLRGAAISLATPSLRQIARSMVTELAVGITVRLGRIRGRHLFLLDIAATAVTVYLVFALRSSAGLAGSLLASYLPAALLPLVVRPWINVGLGMYRRLWRHASVPEFLVIVRAVATGTCVSMAVFYLVLAPLDFPGTADFPRSFWVLEGLLSLFLIAAPRLAIRATAQSDKRARPDPRPSRLKTLLYGAGSVGVMIARSAVRESDAGLEPVGFLDDDPPKKGQRVAGLPVYGGAETMVDAVTLTGAQVLLITMPAADGNAIRRVTKAGLEAGLEVRTVPPIHELIDGGVDAFRVRRVRVEDLIRRPEASRIGPGVEDIVRDRIVLVTGAGGSIGSELARQIYALRPRRLVLVDRAESALYSIQRELEAVAVIGRGEGELEIDLANVASRAHMSRLIGAAAPDVILHAAAFKHVPLMESHPSEAVHINIGGTMAVLDAAVAAGTPTFVLVSTDKAVTPTSTMGATKRVAEWLVADAAQRTGRAYVSVRFGNVLGSAGSVLPIFQGQLEQGQALTITHPEMTRYFMTIAEASSLILQAAAIGRPGDLLVLDMGEPIRIVDLARDFVRLAGRDPDTVPMVFTGVRPGEKLHEELFYEQETAGPTANPKVWLAGATSPVVEIRAVALELLTLADSCHDLDLRDRLFEVVGTRTPVATASITVPAEGAPEPTDQAPASAGSVPQAVGPPSSRP